MLITRLLQNIEMDKGKIKVVQDTTSQIIKFSFISYFFHYL